MATEEMTCQELVEVVSDYIEELMPSNDRARFEEHLATCPYCVTYLEQMRVTIRTLGRLSEDAIDVRSRDKLLETFRDWKAT